MGDDEYANDVIRCICGFTDDDGYTIQCEKCFVWQHVDCVLEEGEKEPANYYCEECLPRPVNKQRAVQKQMEARRGTSRRASNSNSRKDRASPKKTKQRRKDKSDTVLSPYMSRNVSGRKYPEKAAKPAAKPARRRSDYNDLLPRMGGRGPHRFSLPSLDEASTIFSNIRYEHSSVSRPPSPDIFGVEPSRTDDFLKEMDAILLSINKSKKSKSPAHRISKLPFKNMFESQYQIMSDSFHLLAFNRFANLCSEQQAARVCRRITKELARILSEPEAVPDVSIPCKSRLPWGGTEGWTLYQESEPLNHGKVEDFPVILDARAFDLVSGCAVVDTVLKMSESGYHDVDVKGLFSTVHLRANSLVCEIKGSVGFLSELVRKAELSKRGESKKQWVGLFRFPISELETNAQLYLPPFVFAHPAKLLHSPDLLQDCKKPGQPSMKPIENHLVVDARQVGSEDGRFVRSYCGGDPSVKHQANAVLRSVFLIESAVEPEAGREDPDKLHFFKALPPHQQLRLAIFSTKPVAAAEEVVLDFSNTCEYSLFPCICEDVSLCKASMMLQELEAAQDLDAYELRMNQEQLDKLSQPLPKKKWQDVVPRVDSMQVDKISDLAPSASSVSLNDPVKLEREGSIKRKFENRMNGPAEEVTSEEHVPKPPEADASPESAARPKRIKLGDYLNSVAPLKSASSESQAKEAGLNPADAETKTSTLPFIQTQGAGAAEEASQANALPVSARKVVSLKDFMMKKGFSGGALGSRPTTPKHDLMDSSGASTAPTSVARSEEPVDLETNKDPPPASETDDSKPPFSMFSTTDLGGLFGLNDSSPLPKTDKIAESLRWAHSPMPEIRSAPVSSDSADIRPPLQFELRTPSSVESFRRTSESRRSSRESSLEPGETYSSDRRISCGSSSPRRRSPEYHRDRDSERYHSFERRYDRDRERDRDPDRRRREGFRSSREVYRGRSDRPDASHGFRKDSSHH